MKPFIVGLLFLIALGVLTGIGLILSPLFIAMGFLLQFLFLLGFAILCIWLLGKSVIFVWELYKRNK